VPPANFQPKTTGSKIATSEQGKTKPPDFASVPQRIADECRKKCQCKLWRRRNIIQPWIGEILLPPTKYAVFTAPFFIFHAPQWGSVVSIIDRYAGSRAKEDFC
jgi:hypothetical protein